MSSTVIVVGLGLAVAGYAGRYLTRHGKTIARQLDSLPVSSFSKYYKGGFDAKMSRREAALILGVSPSANKVKIKDAHKKIMLLNHPDRGGSPYMASKINEAKDLMETQRNI